MRKRYVLKAYNEYVRNGMVGQTFHLSLRDRIKILFCKKLDVCLFGTSYKFKDDFKDQHEKSYIM